MILASLSVIVTAIFYFVNVWLLSAGGPLSRLSRYYLPNDAFFFEGIFFLAFGILFLLGRGGINLWSVKAAILIALTGAVSKKDTDGPNKIIRRDRWKPEGFVRLGLLLVLTGILMIVVSLPTVTKSRPISLAIVFG